MKRLLLWLLFVPWTAWAGDDSLVPDPIAGGAVLGNPSSSSSSASAGDAAPSAADAAQSADAGAAASDSTAVPADPAVADAGAEGSVVGNGAYQVDRRDTLLIDVYGEKDLSGAFTVTDSGDLDFPLVGRVHVGGLTTDDIGHQLESALGQRFLVDPHVTVRVDRYASKPVQVLGAVKKPGVYYLAGETTLLQILAAAGDVSSDKSIKEVHVRRAGQAEAVVRLDGLLSKGEGDMVLQSGDVVYVPEGMVVFVSGQVDKPGEIVFADGLTVTQAIAKAGGLKSTASKSEAYVLRDGQRLPVNLRKVLRGRTEDFKLQPGDQVFVPESVF